ncbi:MAG: thermonuclease family protein [Rhodobacteraceae bacterium]|nr:thermonuclease family protein [Paracoccaceae bacterium]MBR9819557.1 thermonuclease family protein [Paracoccaceae bacterium]
MRLFPLLLALTLPFAAGAADLSGRARVIDGDTLEIGGQVVRLLDIDAPESAQDCHGAPCGRDSTRYLERMTARRTVHCRGDGMDAYDRLLARCDVDGADIGATMVLAGQAVAYRRYGLAYVDQEKVARIEGRGLWARGTPVMPWDYRAGRWQQASAPGGSAPEGCPIKGNINSKGERIYHTPYSAHYTRTRISTSKGERWFCSEAEALAAGWRAPRR